MVDIKGVRFLTVEKGLTNTGKKTSGMNLDVGLELNRTV